LHEWFSIKKGFQTKIPQEKPPSAEKPTTGGRVFTGLGIDGKNVGKTSKPQKVLPAKLV